MRERIYQLTILGLSVLLLTISIVSCSPVRAFADEQEENYIQVFTYKAIHPFNNTISIPQGLFPSWTNNQFVTLEIPIKEVVEEAIEEEPVNSNEFWLGESVYAPGSQAAIDAGGIVEWDDGYYASHDFDMGAVFFQFQEGSIVHIDGYTVIIEGWNYENREVTSYETMRYNAGWDKICFQTCVDDYGTVVVYYGSAW